MADPIMNCVLKITFIYNNIQIQLEELIFIQKQIQKLLIVTSLDALPFIGSQTFSIECHIEK